MPINPAGRQQIAYSGMYGLNTDVEPADLPEGLSPDTQDVSFVPGKSGTRPAADKVLDSPIAAGVGVTYIKSFVQPNGDPLNLELTSDGKMNMQDVFNSPQTTTNPFNVVPGIYASSVTAFNREYFAFHDGLIAKDIPRSFDGQNWYRLTQDACATSAMTAADAGTTTIPITNIVPKAEVSITTVVLGSGFVTVNTATAHGLAVGDNVLIQGVDTYQYNGPETITTVPSPNSFTYNSGASGLPTGNGGTVIPDTVTVTTTTAHGLISGESIVISGNSDNNYNNSQGISGISVGVASNVQVDTYSYSDANGGAFNYTFPHQGFNEPLPGPIQQLTLTGSEATIMFNPNGPLAGTNLPGAPSENNPPLLAMGVNSSGMYNGTNTPVSSSNFDFALTVTFNIAVSTAGNVTFQIVHKEGTILGIGGGALFVSGQQNDAQPGPPPIRSGTAKNNYPIMYMNNGSTEFYHVSIFNQQFVVNFPAAGIYPVEINYVQWHHSNPVLALLWQNSVPAFVPLQPNSVAFATPATWTVGSVVDSTHFKFDAVYAVGTGTGGTITVGGLLSPGPHQVVCFFQTETDSFTAPSPPISWASAGSKRVQLDNIPIGPPNVKARWFAFTGASGSNYFTIPVPARDPQTGQQVSTSTVVLDNTSTSAQFDFSDNTLFDSIAIDITGNNLFAQVTLGLVANITQYSNRLVVWGDTNKIQNLRSMGFEGGIPTPGSTTPLWWDTSLNNGGQLVAGEFGFAWQITGNGTSSQLGLISQTAYQDYLFLPILTPSTQYTFQCIAYTSNAGAAGSIVAELFSSTDGVLAQAIIPVSELGVGLANAQFVSANFNAMTPTVIPPDAQLRYYAINVNNGVNVVIDETMVVFTAQPTVPGQQRYSYSFNPEAFDGVTGVRQIEYPEPVLDCKILRDNFYIVSQNHLSRTQDNGIGEPVTWTNYTVSDKAGGLSLRCFDLGEGWGIFASDSGLYMFSGGEPVKISQEVQKLWDAIDPVLKKNAWVKNDLANRRIYIGAPITVYPPTGTTFTPQSCNKILVVDYRELNSSGAIENAPPLHISMTGRMLSSDLTRKWTVWNLPMNCGEVMYLPNSDSQICFGSGLGNGLATGFGNFYSLNDKLYADDDYGTIGSFNGESPLTYQQWLISGPPTAIFPQGTRPTTGTWRPRTSYYMTYLSPSHEQEQQLQIGSQRKLYEYLEVYCPGVGSLNMLAFINNIQNSTNRPPAPRMMSLDEVWDLEYPLNLKAQRLALLFYPSPVGILPGISITPVTVTISTFSTEQFSYSLVGTPTQNVLWSCSSGTVSITGLYTAPGVAGTYTVTVTSVDDPSVSATATVTVHGGYDGA